MADAEEAAGATSVLDASAVMALLHDEPGASAVVEAIAAGVAISVINWAEVLSNVAADGDDPRKVADQLIGNGGESVIWVAPLSAEDCIAIAELRPLTTPQGLSLADRACLVLAERLGVPALSADRGWEQADVGAEVKLIR